MQPPIFQLKGIPEALKQLGFRLRRIKDFREPLSLIKNDFFAVEQGWLGSEGRGSWEALKPRYAKWKMKKVGPKPILQFSGNLFADFTGVSDAGVRVTSSSLMIRAARSGNLWLAHQRGTSAGNPSGRARPKRAVVSPAMRIRQNRWNRILRDWAAGQNIGRL